MAVLPTPGSPIRTGLFLVFLDRIWMTRLISVSRPMTGSSLPLAASATAVLGEGLVGYLRHGRGDPLVAADLRERLQEAVPGHARLMQQTAGRGRRTLREQRHDEVLDGDVLVFEPARLLLGHIEQAG